MQLKQKKLSYFKCWLEGLSGVSQAEGITPIKVKKKTSFFQCIYSKFVLFVYSY